MGHSLAAAGVAAAEAEAPRKAEAAVPTAEAAVPKRVAAVLPKPLARAAEAGPMGPRWRHPCQVLPRQQPFPHITPWPPKTGGA